MPSFYADAVRSSGTRAVGISSACVSLAIGLLVLVCSGCDSRPAAVPFGFPMVRYIKVVEDGSRIAFSAEQGFVSDGVSSPMVITDAEGQTVAMTAPPQQPATFHRPMCWIAGGDAVLIERQTFVQDSFGGSEEPSFFVYYPATDETAPVHGSDGAYLRSPVPLDSDTFVCLASPIGKADAANVVAGLQIVRRQNGQWSMAPLEAEGNSRWWQGILWASRTEGGVEFVLKSRTRLSSGQWAWGVWVLCVADGRAQSAELLMAFSMRGHTPISSTRDGRHVFAVEGGLRLGKDEDILHVVARAPDGLTLRDEPIPMGTDTILVSPDGGKAFLACIGWLEDPSCILVRQEAARWRVEDLTESVRPNLSGAAWLSDSEVLLGYPRVGILRWNPETGAQEPFWSF